jgi:hypothetical protein
MPFLIRLLPFLRHLLGLQLCGMASSVALDLRTGRNNPRGRTTTSISNSCCATACAHREHIRRACTRAAANRNGEDSDVNNNAIGCTCYQETTRTCTSHCFLKMEVIEKHCDESVGRIAQFHGALFSISDWHIEDGHELSSRTPRSVQNSELSRNACRHWHSSVGPFLTSRRTSHFRGVASFSCKLSKFPMMLSR